MAASRKNAPEKYAEVDDGNHSRWLGGIVLAAALLGAVGWAVVKLLDPQTLPIRSVQIEGAFRHLSAEQLQRVVAPHVSGGFFTLDIEPIRGALSDRPWVDKVSVRRVWPDTLRIRVIEHQPLASWRGGGLVNVRGEWFAADGEQLEQALPEFAGPEGFQSVLTETYREWNQLLAPTGLTVTHLLLSERRAWQIVLSGGLTLQLGRRQAAERLARFVGAYPTVIAQRPERVAGVDLRYTNGFAVRWSGPEHQVESSGS